MSNTAGPAPDQVEGWLEELDRELAALQDKIEPLLAEQARLQERRTLCKELLASFGDGHWPDVGTARSNLGETTRERIHRQAVDVFTQVGRPLHSNDLHAEFLRRGYEVPGAGKPNNITVHLTGWPDIASPVRGMYGLVQHVGEQPPRTKPNRRRKKRAR